MEKERNKITACLKDEQAFCTAGCPFQLDVRDFMEKMQRGGFNAAFRTYHNAVGFPGIVSQLCDEPCKNVCPRREKDGAISMRLLEKASMDYAKRITPNSYNMPAKNKKIAVIGAGISGLACALRLCTKKYQVTVYEKSHRVGGHLWGLLPGELLLSDINRQFMYEEYELCLNQEIISLDSLDFDAIYVATGAGGIDFGLKRDPMGAFASTRPGVFLGGSLTGKNSCEAIADGLHVVNAIERYIKAGGMNTPEERHETRLHVDPACFTTANPVMPSDGPFFTREEALQEASRCLKCTCDACIKHCDLMRHFRKYPKTIADQVEATINPGTLDGNGTIATRFISTCNQCGLCREICPQGIDVGDFLLKGHRVMREKGAMPWAFHDFWLRDMEFTNGEAAGLCRLPQGYDHSQYMFFPGCQLGASEPRYVTESYRFLLAHKPDTALMLGCCGAPADWAGDEPLHGSVMAKLEEDWIALGKPIAVFACPTCKQMYQKYLPQIEGVFLYDLIRKWGISPSKGAQGETASIFDPCSSREEPDLQQTIRELAKQAGFRLKPLPYEGRLAQCCSWGGQISIADPFYTREIVKTRIRQNEYPYITYCTNCRDIFASALKPVYHILDIIFGLHDAGRVPPTISEGRNNRANLKHQVLREFWKDEVKMEERNQINVQIPPLLREKLHRELILETDIAAVIAYAESSGRKVLDPESGHFTGHLQIGQITYWAEYLPAGNGFELINAYSHRMSIEEA
ncbi:pyridine nucleotide-disulfide oxidoreductase/dicluster-binding protein [Candidatus Formimonas warabiya]|uniref:4Fe-4S ferredoxin-type domain-containing protein n=1 Tax=Formimonas warabiya TaxID=1761012 RepID=A0A3G1KZC7_FORW1|nr:pyridine nucleotide-disulfide oxidoreductase/dicluster-binding protein [Candidatus Formimonas warabiya]ATW27896.1 hypothetical protein DCMF_26875 [Candidatus Formimonas warabiya]